MFKKSLLPDSSEKTIHIFTKISNYAVEFMDFINEHFTIEDHLFCFREITQQQIDEFKYSNRMLSIQDRYFYYFRFPEILKKSKQILLHSFPISYSLIFWLIHKRYLKKTIWSVWGFDLHWYTFCEKSFENILFEKIRKSLIPEVNTILCPVYGDYLLAVDLYKAMAKYHRAMYPIPTNFTYLNEQKIKKENEKEFLKIQIGNSGTITNNLLELLNNLEPLKSDPIIIFCFLSYGEKEYSEEVSRKGKELFGDKFNPITEYLSKEKYADIVSGIDVLIMNNVRQQGLGNILTYLYLGKKVYVRSDNTSFDFFLRNEIVVHDTLELFKNIDFLAIKENDIKIKDRNIKNTGELLSVKTFIREWEPILK